MRLYIANYCNWGNKLKIKKISTVLIISLLFFNSFSQEIKESEDTSISAPQAASSTTSPVSEAQDPSQAGSSPASVTQTSTADSAPAPAESAPSPTVSGSAPLPPVSAPTPTDSTPSKAASAPTKAPDPDTSSSSSSQSFLDKVDFIIQLDPTLYLSQESRKYKSNTMNVLFAFTFGATIPNDAFISFQPTLSFFAMHHSWAGNIALPTEIENRTTTTLSLMLNLPAAFDIQLEKSRLSLTAGAGLLLRLGLLSHGVKGSDTGYSGSASKDVNLINKWFWSKGRFLYASAGASWLYKVNSKLELGPSLNIYIPVVSIMEYKKLQDMIISLGLRICL